MVDWETILISVVIGAVIGAVFTIIIAYWVQKTMKPPSDIVWEENREGESKWTFKQLKRYDESAMKIFNGFETEFGNLEKKRKDLVTTMRFESSEKVLAMKPVLFADIMSDKRKMDSLKVKLEWDLERIQQFPLDYEKERNVETLKKCWKHYFIEVDDYDEKEYSFGSEWVSSLRVPFLKRKQVYKKQFICEECNTIYTNYVKKNQQM